MLLLTGYNLQYGHAIYFYSLTINLDVQTILNMDWAVLDF